MGAVAWGVVAAVPLLVVPGGGAQASQGGLLAPNLRQKAPAALRVMQIPGGRPGYRLGFRSTTVNAGAGSLRIEARRTGRGMVADQVVPVAGGAPVRRPAIGRLAYVRGGGHEHWHLREFLDYELAAVGATGVRRALKTGFCLGDRRALQGAARPTRPPRYRHQCGRQRPTLTAVTMGISPGYTDIYSPFVHGQSFALSGLPSGLYVLTHTANPSRALVESDYADNASSALLRLQRPRGAPPRVSTVRRCPGLSTCLPAGRR